MSIVYKNGNNMSNKLYNFKVNYKMILIKKIILKNKKKKYNIINLLNQVL